VPLEGSAHARLVAAAAGGDVLFHGSNDRTIDVFEPREQLTARDRPVRAVFATPDPLWAMFFAVTDAARAIGRWNMCLRPEESGLPVSRYFFAVRGDPRTVWTEGAVYVAARDLRAERRRGRMDQLRSRRPARGGAGGARRLPLLPAGVPLRASGVDWRRLGRLVVNGVADAFGR
jgi:hypothetical protein